MMLHACQIADIAPGDIVRGVNHSRIVTGPPVRVTSARPIGAGRIRVGYVIIGVWSHGWRDLDASRGVTVERPER